MKSFDINVGFYPGVLLGIRTYRDIYDTTHALYLPFFSIHLVIFKDLEE